MIMLSWLTKIKLELMAYEAMFATRIMEEGPGLGFKRRGGMRSDEKMGREAGDAEAGWI
jgi:hypothetical protein